MITISKDGWMAVFLLRKTHPDLRREWPGRVHTNSGICVRAIRRWHCDREL